MSPGYHREKLAQKPYEGHSKSFELTCDRFDSKLTVKNQGQQLPAVQDFCLHSQQGVCRGQGKWKNRPDCISLPTLIPKRSRKSPLQVLQKKLSSPMSTYSLSLEKDAGFLQLPETVIIYQNSNKLTSRWSCDFSAAPFSSLPAATAVTSYEITELCFEPF